ncbi:MAG: P-II family nitrogen regulator [Candidatus Omnitrophica bacterium]|nr:P-II family nitrogen regulator [Candidatus Omnitrophota bacterium]
MVEIIAVIRRKRRTATTAELERIRCAGYSQWSVLGRGRERGLRDAGGGAGVPFLPKTLFHLVVEDADAAETIEALIRANQTGEFGDGRIFVLEAEQAYRISTGEHGPWRQVTSDR